MECFKLGSTLLLTDVCFPREVLCTKNIVSLEILFSLPGHFFHASIRGAEIMVTAYLALVQNIILSEVPVLLKARNLQIVLLFQILQTIINLCLIAN